LKEHQRAAVFTLGRFSHVAGPGLAFLFPFIQQAAVIDLDEILPSWRHCSPDEVDRIVEYLVKKYPNIPTYHNLQDIRNEIHESEMQFNGE
jgi:hypothetical protein